MDHNRRARPTLRVLREDLTDGWEKNPAVLRAIADEKWEDVQPLSELPHLILRKAVESYGSNPDDDPTASPIASSVELRLLELRSSQWRAGIWTDPSTGVRWVCTVGLAKGNHQDHDDFYQRLKTVVTNGHGSRLLPTDADYRLLNRETVAHQLTEWELAIQEQVKTALKNVDSSGTDTFTVIHPSKPVNMASVEITVNLDDPELEEYVVEIEMPGNVRGTERGWTLIRRVLTSVAPPSQEWDAYDLSFSQMTPPCHREKQIQRLDAAGDVGELLIHEPGTVSHYLHTPHIAGSSVDGNAVRALCGVFFVVSQDHEELSVCPKCEEHYTQLPR